MGRGTSRVTTTRTTTEPDRVRREQVVEVRHPVVEPGEVVLPSPAYGARDEVGELHPGVVA